MDFGCCCATEQLPGIYTRLVSVDGGNSAGNQPKGNVSFHFRRSEISRSSQPAWLHACVLVVVHEDNYNNCARVNSELVVFCSFKRTY